MPILFHQLLVGHPGHGWASWLIGWCLWPPALIYSSLLSRKPPPCARLSLREEWDIQALEQLASSWHVDGTDTIQEDRISASLFQPRVPWLPLGLAPALCLVPVAAQDSAGAAYQEHLLWWHFSQYPVVHYHTNKSHPCNHSFSCSPQHGGRELAEQEGVLEGLAFPGPAGLGCAEASLCLLDTHLQVSRVFRSPGRDGSLNGRQRGWYGLYYLLDPAWMDGRKNGRREFDFDDQGNNLEATILHTAARVHFLKIFYCGYIYI